MNSKEMNQLGKVTSGLNAETKSEFGIQGYEIKQGLDRVGSLRIDLIAVIPNGDCAAYARFMDDFGSFLVSKGYWPESIKTDHSL